MHGSKLSNYFSLTCTNSNVRGRQGNKGLTSCIASGRMTSISEYQTLFLEELNPIGKFCCWKLPCLTKIQSEWILNRTSGLMWAWGQSFLAELKMLWLVSPELAADLVQVTLVPSEDFISLEILEFVTMYLQVMDQWSKCMGSSKATHD